MMEMEVDEIRTNPIINSNKIKFKSHIFGQLVIGPPGSGKTTYCEKMCEFLTKLGRKVAIINIDPGNENMGYKANIDVMDLITVSDAMDHYELGPNGALMYCIEFLEKNFEWLLAEIKKINKSYLIFDCPGQVELYTHHKSMSRIFEKLNIMGYSLCTVNMIDSHYCSEPTKFIATLLLSLNTMLTMGLPHVNVLSKADLLKKFQSKLLFNLEFYTDVLDLKYLLNAIDSSFPKYSKLNAAIVSMVEDYGLVSYQPLDIQDNHSLLRLKNLIDKANGYIYGAGEETSINTLIACAVGAETESERCNKDIDPYII